MPEKSNLYLVQQEAAAPQRATMKPQPRNRRKRLALAAVSDLDFLSGRARVGADLLNRVNDIHAADDAAEHNVLAIQPSGLNRAEEELGAVGVRASVGHGEDALASVLQDEVLIGELVTVDGLAASAVAPGEVATLAHEIRDNAVEVGALEVQGLARLASALLASAESAEVLGRLRGDVG